MRFTIWFSLSVALGVFLLACSSTSTNDSQAIDTPNPLPTPTAKPVPTIRTIPTVTNTRIPPTSTPKTIATATLVPPTPSPKPIPTRSQESPKPTPRPLSSLTPSAVPTATAVLVPTSTVTFLPTQTPLHQPPNPCLTVAEENRKRCEESVTADRLKESGQSGSYYAESFDPDNISKAAKFNFSELDKFSRMSKLRSGVGHDYSFPSAEYDPDGKSCRSMKHYFIPNGVPRANALYRLTPHTFEWMSIKFFAPADGVITNVEYSTTSDGEEAQFSIQSTDYPGYYFNFLHVKPSQGLVEGSLVEAGQQIGTSGNEESWGEIGVEVRVNSRESYFVSFLQVVTDQVLEAYVDRGLVSVSEAIVTRGQRDATPLACGGDAPPAARWFEGSSKFNPDDEFIIWQFESTDNWFFFDGN